MAKSKNKAELRVNPENEKRRQRERAFKRNKSIRDWGLSLAVIFVIVGGIVMYMKISAAKEDLTRVGQGIPMVVQVHDYNCTPCLLLQKEVKQALKSFDKNELGYVIADLNKIEAGRFARLHGAGQTTLLFFDSRGRMKQRLYGVRTAEALENVIKEVLEVEPKA